MNTKAVERVLEAAHIPVDQKTLETLTCFFLELKTWDRCHNLTGIKTLEAMAWNHLGDTLTLLPLIPNGPLDILDIGSGAGVPGLLLKILRPMAKITLVDARRKRISFLRYAISRLGLQGVEAHHTRLPVEEEKRDPLRGRTFDIVLSRAMGSIHLMARLSRPFLGRKGRFILMKGPKGLKELDDFLATEEGERYTVEALETTVPGKEIRRVLLVGRPI